MRIHQLVCSAALLLAGVGSAWAIDEVYPVGDAKVTLARKVTVGRDTITILDGRNEESTMPVADVLYVKFGGEPLELSDAKEQVRRNGKYEEVLASLSKINKATVSPPEAVADLAFYIAMCKAKLALVGKENIRTAGPALVQFINDYPQHYTYYEATELLGDLLRADKNYPKAVEYYGKLAANKEMAARAQVLIGWTHLEQDQPDEAAKAFDAAMADRAMGPTAEAQRRLASVGKAACQIAKGQAADAVKQVEGVIENSPPESLDARMYNVLGSAQAKNNDAKGAVMSFLHVDLMYAQDPAEHAEALGNLKELWKQIGQPERGEDAARRLQRLYPTSQWAKK
ncbi:MAG: tetratricopeptide repeat protein [Pirellulales bacterium]